MTVFQLTRITLHRFLQRSPISSCTRKMSFQAAVSSLRSPIKELVLSVSKDGQELIGNDDADKKEVIGWIEKTSQGTLATKNNLKVLDSILVPKTYVATNYLTAADVALYGALHPIVKKLQSSEYYAVPSVTRYFDHIQSAPTVRASADTLGDEFSLLPFDIDNAPKAERNAEPPKKKEKAPKAPAPEKETPAQTPGTATPAEVSSSSAPTDKLQKKDKKEKKKETQPEASGSKKSGGKAQASDDGEPVPSMIDLRVGHIVDVIKHPDADGLYIEACATARFPKKLF
ncbi:unnamed protein product [Cyclocybe aegerita]|uniref:Uncharacterized protein n=1 Tax=Cyclocybe aegerita TaxID=1973307 RepID=A0A8S0XNU1_CYCAE|nr:unnamed protein product [Cyclocybe aegerita]